MNGTVFALPPLETQATHEHSTKIATLGVTLLTLSVSIAMKDGNTLLTVAANRRNIISFSTDDHRQDCDSDGLNTILMCVAIT